MSITCSEEAVRSYVRSWVIDHAVKSLPARGIGNSDNFVASGIINSMVFVRLLMDTEEAFGLTLDLSEKDPSEFLSIDGFAKCVMECSQQTQSAQSQSGQPTGDFAVAK